MQSLKYLSREGWRQDLAETLEDSKFLIPGYYIFFKFVPEARGGKLKNSTITKTMISALYSSIVISAISLYISPGITITKTFNPIEQYRRWDEILESIDARVHELELPSKLFLSQDEFDEIDRKVIEKYSNK